MATGTLDTHPDLHLTVTDIDPKMVAATAQRLSDRPGTTAHRADATQLPFPNDSFDYCLSYLMLHHVIEWETALAEMRRVLRPGGRLVGYDLTDTRLARTIHILDKSPHRLTGPDELRTKLARSGFHNAHLRTAFAGHLMRFVAGREADPE